MLNLNFRNYAFGRSHNSARLVALDGFKMDDAIRAHDGKLVLYRRNGIWQARLHLGGNNYLPKSLKTANTDEAKRLGEELWHDTRYEVSKGLPVRKRTLNSVLDEYIRFPEEAVA